MSQKIRVIVNGALGRMGTESVNAVKNEEDLLLVKETDMGDDLKSSIEESEADVIVDFTNPENAYKNTNIILESGKAGVIGTTGFSADQIEELREKCQDRSPAIIIVPNFAIGAILMMHCSKIIAKYMPHVEIIELHHDKKLDAPSGTAVKTAELIASERKSSDVPRGTFEKGARGELFSDIPVHSVRLPGLLAHQEVIFGAEGQTLSLRHDSINRTCFMPGVIMAIRASLKEKGLIYGLDTLLFS